MKSTLIFLGLVIGEITLLVVAFFAAAEFLESVGAMDKVNILGHWFDEWSLASLIIFWIFVGIGDIFSALYFVRANFRWAERLADRRHGSSGYGKGIQIKMDVDTNKIEEARELVRQIRREYVPRPTIVCLCGSTRFWKEFQRAGLRETLAGRIVLSIGAAAGTDDDHFGSISRAEYDRVKLMLDELHKRKIDLADEILVLNVDGYIGESTRSEIEYAVQHGKPVRWLEQPIEIISDKGEQ